MFKNYLTYSFAQNFVLSCRSLEIDPVHKERLLKSADAMLLHLTRFMHATDPKDELRYLFVTLTCLRDCRESLDEWGTPWPEELRLQYDYVHARLERMCLDASEAEGGQLRMLG
jgi:hypothetical protein